MGYGVYYSDQVSPNDSGAAQNVFGSPSKPSNTQTLSHMQYFKSYSVFAFEFKSPFNHIASFTLPSGQVPVELLSSPSKENILFVGCETTLFIIMLNMNDGTSEPPTLSLVKKVSIDIGTMQDYCLLNSYVYAKNDNNDIIEMKFNNQI